MYSFLDWCNDNDRHDLINLWDEKLNCQFISDVSYKSNKKYYFKCPNGIHESKLQNIQYFSSGKQSKLICDKCLSIGQYIIDHPDYKRKISSSNTHGFRCPKCSHIDAGNKNSIDLTGMEFGKLKVIEYGYSKNNRRYWLCQCSCGSEPKYISVGHLISGSIISCGCYHIESISGENNRNWKGGITAENLSARSSSEYERWRKAVYKKDNFTCQCCGKKCNKLNAHHIYSFSDHKEIRYDLNNGITMCEKCHYSSIIGSFHNIYGTQNNTPEQLIEYINKIRKINNIDIIFSLDDYLSGKNILS